MRMTRRWLVAAALGLAAGGCGKDRPSPPPPPRPAVLVYVPKPGRSLLVDTTGTPDAERMTLVVSLSGDSVAAFYRAGLAAQGWRMVSDRDEPGYIDLHATRSSGHAIWVHIERQDTASARYTLIATGPKPGGDSAR